MLHQATIFGQLYFLARKKNNFVLFAVSDLSLVVAGQQQDIEKKVEQRASALDTVPTNKNIVGEIFAKKNLINCFKIVEICAQSQGNANWQIEL